MSKQIWIVSAIVLVLGVGCIYFFWHSSPHDIHVMAQLGLSRLGNQPDPTADAGAYPIFFSFDRRYTVTSVAVFNVLDIEFEGKNAKPLWHMVADSAAEPKPLRGFPYGRPIPGLKPADPDNPDPPPLMPGKLYRLVVEIGRDKGTTDFQTRELPTRQ